jgi:hypothetical protein
MLDIGPFTVSCHDALRYYSRVTGSE